MNSEFFDLDGKFERECKSKGYSYKDYYFYMTSDGQYHHNIPFCTIFKIYLGCTFALFALYALMAAPCNLLYSDLCIDNNWVDEINLQILYNLEKPENSPTGHQPEESQSNQTNYPFSPQALAYMRNNACYLGKSSECFTNATIAKYAAYTEDFPEFTNYCAWSPLNEKAVAKTSALTTRKINLHENPAHNLVQNSHSCYMVGKGCPALSCNSLPFLLYIFALFAVNSALTYCCFVAGSTSISLICFWFDDIKNRISHTDSKYMANSSMYDFKMQ